MGADRARRTGAEGAVASGTRHRQRHGEGAANSWSSALRTQTPASRSPYSHAQITKSGRC